MEKIFTRVIMVVCCSIMGITTNAQKSQKRKLTPDDYGLWSTLGQASISPDGNWISYELRYDSKRDTIFLKNTQTFKVYDYPLGYTPAFSKDGKWFTVNDPEKGLLLRNLRTGSVEILGNTSQSQFIGNEKFLLLRRQEGDVEELRIMDLDTGEKYIIGSVLECAVTLDGKSIGYITTDFRVGYIGIASSFKKSKELVSNNESLPYKNLVWNNEGTAVAFFQELPRQSDEEANHRLYYFTDVQKQGNAFCLDPSSDGSPVNGKNIVLMPAVTALTIAPDNQRVFFTVAVPQKQVNREDEVEVWNAAEPLEAGRRQIIGNPEGRPKLVAWWPKEDDILEIGTDKEPSVYLTADRKKAVLYDPYQYEPQEEIDSPSDFSIVDVATGKRKSFLKKQFRKVGTMGASPDSRYLHYFRDKNWWVYDITNDRHLNLTEDLGNFEDIEYDRGGLAPPYGCPGWTSDGTKILVYDHYDIWLLSPKESKAVRLTKGREIGIRFRIYENSFSNYRTFQMIDFIGNNFDLSEGLILEAFGEDRSSGYYSWSEKKGVAKIVYGASRWGRLKKSFKKDAYIAVNQDADLSPQIVGFNKSAKKTKILVETNKQQDQYYWGTAERISYSTGNGIKLQGILFYPANYQPDKKYPMIVNVYERQSEALHNYYQPTLYRPAGFVPVNYTADGYFVLYPDIVYQVGEPGQSAVSCVEAGVLQVIKTGKVEEKRIGLIGHSYGGYEASFIATKSKLFAAIVAGAAVTDLVGHSLSLDVSGRSQMWRYQTHQMRMGNMLYGDYQGFIDNSPIKYAADITTPLLSWTGSKDNMVEERQSIELHNAMRHLKKAHVLLRYPGQDHVLTKPEYQKDLSLRIKAWFDYYLKDLPFPKGFQM